MSYRLGYTPLSARERQISDGSKYDKYFEAPKMKSTLQLKNGDVDDTVKLMKKIVDKYSYQVRKLAKLLEARNADKSINIQKSVNNIFDFVFKYIKYDIEDGEQLQTPAHTWYQAQVMAREHPGDKRYSADCDCMSIFCGSLCKEMGIPFSFRVTGYENIFGQTNGFQHVYCVARNPQTNTEIICDPVTNYFDYEKPYSIVKTFPMSLQGNDIYVLSGFEGTMGDADNIYIEQPDGGLGLLSGKKKAAKKAKRAAKKETNKAKKAKRKAAKVEKKQAKKEIKAARKSGDKEALAKAKEKKKAAKKVISENRTGIAKAAAKVGKGIAKFTTKTALFLPRKMFLVLLRLNFRGLARKLSNNQTAYTKFEGVWKKLGGESKQLKKAIDKGKDKKALFGSKKNVGNTEQQAIEIGQILHGFGMLGSLGVEPTTTVAAAMASAAPIIAKVLSVMQEVGEFIPESADEVGPDGTAPDPYESQSVDFDQATWSEEYNGEDEEPADDYEADEEMEPSEYSDYEDGAFYVDDDPYGDDGEELDGLRGLGKGLFKKVFQKVGSGEKTMVSKVKTKRAEKKASKQSQKQAKKDAKASKKSTQSAKKQKKQADKQVKQAKQANKQSKKAAKQSAPMPTPEQAPEAASENLFTKGKNFVMDNFDTDALIQNGAQFLQSKIPGANSSTANPYPQYQQAPVPGPVPAAGNQKNNGNMKEDGFVKKNKVLLITLGAVALIATGVIVFKDEIFGTGDKKKGSSLSGLNPIKKIEIN